MLYNRMSYVIFTRERYVCVFKRLPTHTFSRPAYILTPNAVLNSKINNNKRQTTTKSAYAICIAYTAPCTSDTGLSHKNRILHFTLLLSPTSERTHTHLHLYILFVLLLHFFYHYKSVAQFLVRTCIRAIHRCLCRAADKH